MKKIVAINASPRKGWNTDIIVMEAAKGAESTGAYIKPKFPTQNYTLLSKL